MKQAILKLNQKELKNLYMMIDYYKNDVQFLSELDDQVITKIYLAGKDANIKLQSKVFGI